MSLNLGTAAIEAARELRNSEHWKAVIAGMLEQSRKAMNVVLDAQMPDGSRHDMAGYARALRDVYMAFHAATEARPLQRVEMPGPVDSSTLAGLVASPAKK